ncbi:hypothetical protein Tco_0908713 [Tanacetum coccineum]|uniref:Uncharacterized protein n=1 Tax=Tanacetum coccineum TaxID=301880 RepID=A0ABQ5CR88_9ASTR
MQCTRSDGVSWVWKSVRYGVSKELDTAYWGFLGVGTTLDIFQNIIFIPYLEYGVLSLSGYGVLSFILCGLMVLPDNQGSSPKSVLDYKAFEDSSHDSDFDVDLHLNDEEDNGNNVAVPQTPSEEV